MILEWNAIFFYSDDWAMEEKEKSNYIGRNYAINTIMKGRKGKKINFVC